MLTTEEMSQAGHALLAAVLAKNGTILEDLTISADDFPEPVHGAIFTAAQKLHRDGKPVDMITLSEAVKPAQRRFVTELNEYTHLAYNLDAWAEIIEHHGTRRRLQAAATQIASLDPEMSSAEMVDAAQGIIGNITAGSARPQYRFVRDLVDDVLVSVAEGGTFVPTPWPSLDKGIGGFRPGDVYVVAARPGVGKTVIAAQMATALADHGAVAFSSLEMSAAELVQRLISERALVNVRNLKHSRLTDRDLELIGSKRDALMKLNIAIDDRASVGPSDVRAFVRALSKRHQVSGVVVDYLQLMTSRSNQKTNREQQISEFSRQMKIIAKQFEVPVILLSQLNREVEKRPNGRPILADLRESGSIEQDASVVMMLRREGEMPNERLIIGVEKNRHGETGEVELDWQGYFSRAVELE